MANLKIVSTLFSLVLCLSFCLANGKDERRMHSLKHYRQRQALPLRDDNDYLHESVGPIPSGEEDYIDEDYTNSGRNARRHSQIPDRPKSLRLAKTKRRDSSIQLKSDTSMEDVMSMISTEASVTIDLCPSECTCLNDFMSCSQLQQSDELPKIPRFISSLELFHSHLNAEMCEQNIRDAKNLLALRVNNNKLTRIPVFRGLVLLEKLELMHNEIRAIAITALRALPKLTYLDLSGNRILNIEANVFPKMNALQKL